MKERIKELITVLKHSPGVYLMHNKDDEIIYVGKAKDLYKRVSQYFLRPQAGKVQKMAMEAEYFETIITGNEKEALILEMNLIQKYYPKYNIMLMDDKHYPYIALTKKGDPVLRIKRNKKDRNYSYYGPFPSSNSAFTMIGLLNQLFPLRKCKNLPKEPCLYYHLGTCLGPCINKISEEKNNQIRHEVSEFLDGNNKAKYNEIKEKMLACSEKLNFEQAASYKKLLDSIDHINQVQVVEINDKHPIDVFAFSIRENFFALSLLLFRQGKLLANEVHIVELFGEVEDTFQNLIEQYYSTHELPFQVVVSSKEVASNLDELLDAHVICSTRGQNFELAERAKLNADNELDEFFLSAKKNDDKIELLEELGKMLHIQTPLCIQLFDNSHIQGALPVGAMVTFTNGVPNKKMYRKFNINQVEARSDVDSMKEVIKRHYSRVKEEKSKVPDLILVDGGITQVHAAIESLMDIDMHINVFGLYKNDKHSTKGIIDEEGRIYEITDKRILFLLTRMQDEVHRFAITFHRSKRNKNMTKSFLDDIKGLGPKKQELIKKHYPTLEQLKEAKVDELSQLLGEKLAKELANALKFQ